LFSKGYEDALRKHHTSSVTRDVGYLMSSKKKRTQLNRRRRPRAGVQQRQSTYFLLSDRQSQNIFKPKLSAKTATAITFKNNPVRI
jgi:hypothetical protein